MKGDPFEMLLLYSVIIIVTILVTRAVFSIGTIVENLKKQTELLEKIASENKLEKPKESVGVIENPGDLNDPAVMDKLLTTLKK